MVGLIPLFAVETLEPDLLARAAGVQAALRVVPRATAPTWPRWSRAGRRAGPGERRLLSLLRGHRMKRRLARMLDENEFLSTLRHARALAVHREQPYVFDRKRTASEHV